MALFRALGGAKEHSLSRARWPNVRILTAAIAIGIPREVKIERYTGVQGKRNVAKICEALEVCGATILTKPNPTVAPYELRFRTPGGQETDLVCYAFTANEYRQRGRAAGEHRFQIKYGSDFKRAHTLFFDPRRQKVTLMFGVHHEQELFVCVDPQMHNPTWFSMSVEFKESELSKAKKSGWHSWERERSSVRRVLEMPQANLSTEAIGAFAAENFLRYVAFEQMASGMDTGERGLLWDKAGQGGLESRTKLQGLVGHPLEQMLGLPASQILDVVQEHFRLLVALRGSVAEYHLGEVLRNMEGIEDVQPLDKDGEPDFVVTFKREKLRIECKNTLRSRTALGFPKVDFQKTRASKSDPCSRFYSPDHFEVLAACLHPVTEKWEYSFCPTSALAPHPKCPERLATNVVVSGDRWSRELRPR